MHQWKEGWQWESPASTDLSRESSSWISWHGIPGKLGSTLANCRFYFEKFQLPNDPLFWSGLGKLYYVDGRGFGLKIQILSCENLVGGEPSQTTWHEQDFPLPFGFLLPYLFQGKCKRDQPFFFSSILEHQSWAEVFWYLEQNIWAVPSFWWHISEETKMIWNWEANDFAYL